jgi:hypothetical protein
MEVEASKYRSDLALSADGRRSSALFPHRHSIEAKPDLQKLLVQDMGRLSRARTRRDREDHLMNVYIGF